MTMLPHFEEAEEEAGRSVRRTHAPSSPSTHGVYHFDVGRLHLEKDESRRLVVKGATSSVEKWLQTSGGAVEHAVQMTPDESLAISADVMLYDGEMLMGGGRLDGLREGEPCFVAYAPAPMCRMHTTRKRGPYERYNEDTNRRDILVHHTVEGTMGTPLRLRHHIFNNWSEDEEDALSVNDGTRVLKMQRKGDVLELWLMREDVETSMEVMIKEFQYQRRLRDRD